MQPYAKKVALGSAIALSAGGGYLALNKRRPILMEAYLKREKLPIYPAPQPEIVLVETSSDLESHIAVAREQTTSVFRSVRDETQKVVSMWINIERRAAAHVKRVVPDDEPLTPGIAWVGVSTLAGSLVARNRTFLLRMIAPPAFFLISLPYFLPKLAANLSREVSTTTAVRAPEFHGQAAALKHQLDDTFEHAEDWFQDTRESVAGTVGKTVSFVERKTGLQLYQAFESSFSRRPEVGHHGHETEHSAPAHERVAISAKPVDHATVPLFMQTPTTASTLPGTPIPAPGTTTAGSPVQTLDVPIYRRVGGPASTTEQLDAAAARVLSKVEDKVADGVRAAKASDAGQAAANAADQAKADVGSGLSSLKRKAENALHSADHNAARAVGATTDAVEAGERKLGQTVDAGKRKAGEAVDAAKASAKVAASEAQAEANRVVSGLSQGSLARTAGDKAQVAASEAKAEAGRVFRGLDNGADARTLASGAGDKAKSAAREAQAEASHVARGLDNGGSLAQTAGDKAKTAANEAQAEASRIIRGLDGGVDTRSLPQTAGDKAKALAHEAQEKATSAARAVRSKTAEFADSAQDKAASTASTARSEAAQLSNEGSRAAHRAEDATAEAARSARQQAERAASATRAEASHLSHEASLLASAAQAKGSQLAHNAQQAASSAARTVESKAAELGREGKALFQAGEDKARSALASAEGKANRAASAVESSLDHAKAEAKDGLERVKSEAADAKRAATNADKRLKVDEQTVDGKRQEQPPVVGLLAGRERETGYKKLV